MNAKEALVASLLGLTILCSVAFAAAYATSAQTQLCAALIAIALGALAAAMVVWEHQLLPRRETTEERGSLPSADAKNAAAANVLMEGTREVVARRGWLVRIFAGAAGALGLALLFPLRSLAPGDANISELRHTSWRRGSRLVREDGTLVRASDLEIDSVVTVFPEGHVGPEYANAMTNDATVLVRVPVTELQLPVERAAWGPQGLLAFSKVCTHAGCPVALYRAAARELFCPCHQSTFDVLVGGKRVFGPAARALPQLPIAIAPDGTLEALGDFPEPIGPGYWERA